LARTLRFAVGVAAALALFSATGRTQAQTAATRPTRRLITGAVDLSRMVALRGNTRPEANAANDRGAVAADLRLDRMQLQLRLPAEKQQELDQLTRDQQDPKSPNYHKWLAPAEFAERFSLAPEDIDAITSWLKSAGFTVDAVNPQSIVFSGTAGQVRSAFRAEIHNLEVRGERHIANMADPQIPAALAPAVIGVVSLNDFKPRPGIRPRAAYTPGNGTFPVVPADLATIYNLNFAFAAGYTGQGQTIVLLEDSDLYTAADWFTFHLAFGLSTGPLQTVHPSPATGAFDCFDPGAVPGPEAEATIDAEWAAAAAPNASIEIASCADTTTNFGGFVALENLLNSTSTPPAVVSLSYGVSEAELGAAFNAYVSALYEQGASEGVSIFASAGDAGAAKFDQNETAATHGIGISGFASTPYNVAVGGTDFGDTFAGTTSAYWNSTNTPSSGSAISYIPEIPWNESCASVLIATHLGYATTYGANGLCNSIASNSPLLTTGAGSGGPSGCASGYPALFGVVGGLCAGYPKPYWQSLVGNPNDGVRDIPDVSLFAAAGYWSHYYVVCWSDVNNGGSPCGGPPSGWSGFGGTSFAAPIMAGIQALIDQKTGERQGNPAPIYYALAAQEYGASGNAACNSTLGNGVSGTCTFYDVTQGDTDVNCTGTINCFTPSGANGVLSVSSSSYQPAYTATAGWDFATGIGTVNAYNLIKNWPQSGITASSGTPQTTVISTQFAAPLVAKITNASGNPVSGITVTFRAPTSGASGAFAGSNTATTDASGIATAPAFTANGTTGSYTVVATAPDIVGAANFSLTNTLSTPAGVRVVSGSWQSTTINTAFLSPLVAMVNDAGGNPMSNITVTFTALFGTGGQGAAFVGGISTATTDGRGQASVFVSANGSAGLFTINASASGALPANFTLSNTLSSAVYGSPSNGSSQSAAITTTFAVRFSLTALDSSLHPVSGAFVTFAAPATGPSGTFTGGATSDVEMTDFTGKATSTPFTANLMAGSYAVFANAGPNNINAYLAKYDLTNTPGPPSSIVKAAGDQQLAGVNGLFPRSLIVTVRDQGGNPVTGAPVTFTAPSSGPSLQFGPSGGAQITLNTVFGSAVASLPTANGIAGAYTVLATVPGVAQPALFNLANLNIGLTSLAFGTVQVNRGSSTTVTLNVGTNPAGITLAQPVALSCKVGSPSPGLDATCTVTPATVQVGRSGTTATVTINSAAGSRLVSPGYGRPIAPIDSVWVLAACFAALTLFVMPQMPRPSWSAAPRRLPAFLTLALVVSLATALVSCSGGNSDSASDTHTGAGTIAVSASGDGLSNTITIPINVN